MLPINALCAALVPALILSSSAIAADDVCLQLAPKTPNEVVLGCIIQQRKEIFALRNLIEKRLFGDVDSVYTIAAEYDLASDEFEATPIYIYADPDKHNIRAVINSIGLITSGKRRITFSYDLIVNKRELYQNASQVDKDITDFIKRNPLQGTGGGGREDDKGTNVALSYPSYIQLIEIRPQIPKPDLLPAEPTLSNSKIKAPRVVNVQGYILVTRRSQSEP